MQRLLPISLLLLILLLIATPSMSKIDIGTAQAEPAPIAVSNPVATQAQMADALQSAPVMFIENVGQFDEDARFHVRGGDYDLWLADDALWITLLEAADDEDLREPFNPEAHLRKNNELD